LHTENTHKALLSYWRLRAWFVQNLSPTSRFDRLSGRKSASNRFHNRKTHWLETILWSALLKQVQN